MNALQIPAAVLQNLSNQPQLCHNDLLKIYEGRPNITVDFKIMMFNKYMRTNSCVLSACTINTAVLQNLENQHQHPWGGSQIRIG